MYEIERKDDGLHFSNDAKDYLKKNTHPNEIIKQELVFYDEKLTRILTQTSIYAGNACLSTDNYCCKDGKIFSTSENNLENVKYVDIVVSICNFTKMSSDP